MLLPITFPNAQNARSSHNGPAKRLLPAILLKLSQSLGKAPGKGAPQGRSAAALAARLPGVGLGHARRQQRLLLALFHGFGREILDQLVEHPMPVDLGFEMGEDRAEAKRGAIHEDE